MKPANASLFRAEFDRRLPAPPFAGQIGD